MCLDPQAIFLSFEAIFNGAKHMLISFALDLAFFWYSLLVVLLKRHEG